MEGYRVYIGITQGLYRGCRSHKDGPLSLQFLFPFRDLTEMIRFVSCTTQGKLAFLRIRTCALCLYNLTACGSAAFYMSGVSFPLNGSFPK